MNIDQQRYFKRAITNYGVDINIDTVWFIDEGKVYYGRKVAGEVVDFISGYIHGNVFIVDFITESERLDICGWDIFIRSNLELAYIDLR